MTLLLIFWSVLYRALFTADAPALVVEVLTRNPPGVGPWIDLHRRAAPIPQALPAQLVLRSIGSAGEPVSTVRLRRA